MSITSGPQGAILFSVAKVDIQAAAGDGPGSKPPRVSILAYTGGAMKPAGWSELAIDLVGADTAGQIPILAGHAEDLDALAGQGRAEIRSGQLFVAGPLTEATAAGRLVIGLARSGVNLQASIGYAPEVTEHLPAGQTVQLNGRRITAGPRGLTIIRKGRLREVSLLPIGADPGTSVSISAKGNPHMATLPIETPDDQISAQMAARLPENLPGLSDPERIRARWQRETWHFDEGPKQRAEAAMLSAAAGRLSYADFENQLLREKAADSELAFLRAERPRGPAIHSSTRDFEPQTIHAAFARSAGVRDLEKSFKPEILEMADRHGNIGLQELLIKAASERGWTGGRNRITGGNLREVLAYALPTPGIQAAGNISTIDVAGILSNVASKVLLEGWNAVEQTYRAISRPRPVSDFKLTTCFRLSASVEYEQVTAGGSIPSGTLGEESFVIAARTYAKLIALSRTQIINDDLGAFDDIRARLGRGAGLALNRIFWTAFLNDAACFTEARGNLITGAPSALADDGASLDAANLAFAAVTDADGGPMGIAPRLLLVPPVLGSIARRLYVSAERRDTTANKQILVANIFQNRFQPLESAYLSSAAIAGSSATGWYLLASPNDLPVAEIAYLDGKESPTIESAEADFDTLGIQFRGYHDFGVSLAEWRAGVKSTGSA